MKNSNCGILIISVVLVMLWSNNNIFAQYIDENDLTEYWYGGDYVATEDTTMDWMTFLSFEPNRSNVISPLDFCTGIQCQLSSFNDEQKLEVYRRMNKNSREEFVYGKNSWKKLNVNIHSESFSNIFLATWDEEIASYAQQKAALCLDTSPVHGHIHDGPLQPHWNRYPDRYPKDSHCKVLATSDSYPINEYVEKRSEIPKKVHYGYVVSNRTVTETKNETRILYRGLASYAFGCGIIVRKNESHYIEHVVCYDCPSIVLERMIRKYLPRNGTPCTACKGYYGLNDIQCTSEVDPPLAKAYGLKFRGLCFTDVIPTRKFTDTLYPKHQCPHGYTTSKTTPTTIPMTRLTTLMINTATIRQSTTEESELEEPTNEHSCQIYIHIFITALTFGLVIYTFIVDHTIIP